MSIVTALPFCQKGISCDHCETHREEYHATGVNRSEKVKRREESAENRTKCLSLRTESLIEMRHYLNRCNLGWICVSHIAVPNSWYRGAR